MDERDKYNRMMKIAEEIKDMWGKHRNNLTREEMEGILLIVEVLDSMYVPERTELH